MCPCHTHTHLHIIAKAVKENRLTEKTLFLNVFWQKLSSYTKVLTTTENLKCAVRVLVVAVAVVAAHKL